MTTAKEKKATKTNEFIDQAETQVKDWLDHFSSLEENMRDSGEDIKQTYHDRVADLKSTLGEVEDRLDDLKASSPDDWDQNRYRFQQASWKYQQGYTSLITDMKKDEHHVSAGWLEGFTDKPPTGSAGWLEGSGVEPTGSEGWVEGMAKRGPKSEGWVEGYSKN